MKPVSLFAALLLITVDSGHAAEVADELAIQQTEADFVAANPGTGLAALENEILLSQSGVDNFAVAEQFANNRSVISIEQDGGNNAAGAFQGNGVLNRIGITQLGDFNFATVTQTGDNNSADISQSNAENRLVLEQGGGANAATIIQNGNSELNLVQTGGQSAIITLEGTNLGAITQTSPTLNLTITPSP